jgi:hypothetical protein
VSQSSWYEPRPVSRRIPVRRRDKVECAIALLLLVGLLGLLLVGVADGDPGAPGPAASPAP